MMLGRAVRMMRLCSRSYVVYASVTTSRYDRVMVSTVMIRVVCLTIVVVATVAVVIVVVLLLALTLAVFFVFHASILKPYFNLTFREIEIARQFPTLLL